MEQTYTPNYLYEYAQGNENDSATHRESHAGTDVYQRLMWDTSTQDKFCSRLLLQHVESSLPYPDSHLIVDNISWVLTGTSDDGSWGDHRLWLTMGFGFTHYSGIRDLTTFDLVFNLRFRLVQRLSLEFSSTTPLADLFNAVAGNTFYPQSGLYGTSLRMDWRHVGIRFGYRGIQLGPARNRNSVYTSVIFKY